MAPGRPRGSRSRRVSLPGVAELLRPAGRGTAVEALRQASGRERHTQKITVYLSGGELADLDAEGDHSLVARRLWEGTQPE